MKLFNRKLSLIILSLFVLGSLNKTSLASDGANPDMNRTWMRLAPIPKSADDRSLLLKALDWSPTGVAPHSHASPCTSDFLKSQIQSAQGNSPLLFENLRKYFDQCDKVLSRQASGPKKEILDIAGAKYNFTDNPLLRDITVTLRDGTIRRGILALKDSAEPRPLVIAIQGVCENRYDFGSRLILMHLFDASPFNVLILSNSTGSDYIRDNKRFSVGGLRDGKEISEVISLFSSVDSPFKNQISSIHVAGESLGAHTALYTPFYDDPHMGPQVKSVQAFCPVVNLKESFGVFFMNNPNLNQVCAASFKTAQEVLGLAPLPAGQQSAEIINKISYQDTLYPPFGDRNLTNLDDFWKFNRFEDFITLSKVPTLLWSSSDDPVVSPTLNSLSLEAKVKKENVDNFGIINVSKGSHCAFDAAYGIDVVTTLSNEFILSQSPEFNLQKRTQTLKLPTPKEILTIEKGERYFGSEWTVPEKKKYALLTIKIWNPETQSDNLRCDLGSPYTAESKCFRQVEIHVPLSALNFQYPYPVSTDTQSSAYARWLNARVKVVTERGDGIVNTTEKPARLIWYQD